MTTTTSVINGILMLNEKVKSTHVFGLKTGYGILVCQSAAFKTDDMIR